MIRNLLTFALGSALVITALAPASAQPSGSYQQSCRNVRVRGDRLTASCTSPQGRYIRSSLNLRSCRNGDIANVNGQLACNWSGNGNGYGRGRDRGYDRDRDRHNRNDRD